MIKHLMAAAVAAATLLPTGEVRADSPVVVELFTSQGCSSCPPADQILGELARREDVIALSLHVDYWDYLGWKDAFAKPEHTVRQRGYAKASGETMMFTPQMIIGGSDSVVGSRAMELVKVIDAHKSRQSRVALQVSQEGAGKLRILAQRLSDVPGKMLVQVVRFIPERVAQIKSGENAGKSITYHNVVEAIEPVAQWNGGADLDMQADVPGDARSVVIIQDGASGPVLAAAQVK